MHTGYPINLPHLLDDLGTDTLAFSLFLLGGRLAEPLDEDKMAELNGLVDNEGDPAEKVAEDYLKEIGIL